MTIPNLSLRSLRALRAAFPIARHTRLSSSSSRPSPTIPPFGQHPSPPRLPATEQAEFERLQRKSGILPPSPAELAAALAQQIPDNLNITSPSSSSPDAPNDGQPVATTASPDPATTAGAAAGEAAPPPATETSSGGVFRGAPPEFEGEVNPRTGEVGGPKNEPLRWGGQGDWSYNGRVTDF